jgi:hypothetical protein
MIKDSIHVLFGNGVLHMNIMQVFIKFVLNFIDSTNKFDGSSNHQMNSSSKKLQKYNKK